MSEASTHLYVLGLGSNMRVPGLGPPADVLNHVAARLPSYGVTLKAMSPIIRSRPVGPSQRTFANAAAVAETALEPHDLLATLKRLEHQYGRNRRGQRWRARPLDLDIVLWSGGLWASEGLSIPHPRFRRRDFVLGPAAAIAPGWRDPISGLTLAQLFARLTRPRPAPR